MVPTHGLHPHQLLVVVQVVDSLGLGSLDLGQPLHVARLLRLRSSHGERVGFRLVMLDGHPRPTFEGHGTWWIASSHWAIWCSTWAM